jgi:hypothetical protein
MQNFIFEDTLEDLSLCDRLVTHHRNARKSPGKVFNGLVDKSFKDSTDCVLDDPALEQDYINALQKITDKYIQMYPSCDLYSPWSIKETINIQHYAPGQGFKGWHTERVCAEPVCASRHLVFMTYLNDVTDQGGTEFMNQRFTATATKGKTLIWPADWTHTHRGVVSPSQDKFIVTGWYSFTE